VVLNPGDCQISSEDMPGWLVASEGALTVALDVEITLSLKQEGETREVANRVQNVRKNSGLLVTDRIITDVYSDSKGLDGSINAYQGWINQQTLSGATVVHAYSQAPSDAVDVEWPEYPMRIKITKK